MKLKKKHLSLQYDPVIKLTKKEDMELFNFIYSDEYTCKDTTLTLIIDEGY